MSKSRNGAKIYSSGLPNVGVGQKPRTSHINRLSEGVDRNRITSFSGGTVSQNSNGTSIHVKFKGQQFPFQVAILGTRVLMVMGNVHTNGMGGLPIQSYIPNTSETDTVPNGGQCFYDYLPNVDVNTNRRYITFDRGETAQMNPLAKSKLLYVSISSGGAAIFRYEDWSSSMEELQSFDFRTSVPIALITAENSLVQIVKSDIWGPAESYPFKIYTQLDAVENTFYAMLADGTINNIIPTKADKIYLNTGINYIWLKALGEPKPASFPESAEIIANQDSTDDSDEHGGRILLGTVVVQEHGGSPVVKTAQVSQFVKNSLWAEAHRYEKDKVDYFYYHI